ncbi:MAG: hypothetical protein Q7J35_06700 [Candidatus Methanoperedens sp.]|nr:hypothetical protein [Candidatus Methanoperedens sp.]
MKTVQKVKEVKTEEVISGNDNLFLAGIFVLMGMVHTRMLMLSLKN